MEWLKPLIEQLGFGGLTGAIAGYAAKKIAKLAALVLGLLFILLQYLAYKGWVDIQWGEVGKAAAPHLAHGGKSAGMSVWKVLTHNIPFGGAFAAGFWLGFKKG